MKTNDCTDLLFNIDFVNVTVVTAVTYCLYCYPINIYRWLSLIWPCLMSFLLQKLQVRLLHFVNHMVLNSL